MKYRILFLLALLCAIPVAAAAGTLASYSHETAFSFNIEADMSGMELQAQNVEPTTPEADEITPEAGLQTPPAEIQPQQPPEETPADLGAAEEPQQDNQPAEELPQKILDPMPETSGAPDVVQTPVV